MYLHYGNQKTVASDYLFLLAIMNGHITGEILDRIRESFGKGNDADLSIDALNGIKLDTQRFIFWRELA